MQLFRAAMAVLLFICLLPLMSMAVAIGGAAGLDRYRIARCRTSPPPTLHRSHWPVPGVDLDGRPVLLRLPGVRRPSAVKAAEDCGGSEVDADTRTFDPDPHMESRLGAFMRGLVGDRFGRPRSTTCLYTMTSDRDFVVDRLPDIPQVVVGLGAAHGFKFAAWFGRTLAGLACGDASGPELAPFAYARPSLHVPITREAWLV